MLATFISESFAKSLDMIPRIGSAVTVSNTSWKGSLPPNASTTFGFLASGGPAALALTCTSP